MNTDLDFHLWCDDLWLFWLTWHSYKELVDDLLTDVAERVFDRCLNYGQEKNPERPAYEITFNYEFLDDTYMPWIHEDYRKRMRADDTASMSDSSSMGKTEGVGLFVCF